MPQAGVVEPLHAGVLDHLPDTDLCEDCEDVVSDYFCNVCQCSLCADCWDRQPAHRRKRLAPGQIPHEKTELLLANRVQTVFSSVVDQRALERLHKDDEATAWFGLEREIRDGQPLMFRDHGRFGTLSTSSHHSLFRQGRHTADSNPEGINCVPSLVSFVGQTGAGKSTLIKMLIHFNQWSGRNYDFPSPIPGIVGRDLPTSEDVHLYADPITAGSEAPIFFADSEGLDGGEREPLAATLRKHRERAESESLGSESDYTPKNYTEREIAWMTTKIKRTRQFAAGQLYPRILFAFSDVVVFVHRNPRAIEGVLERLLEWGSVAIETTYNQPILPYAIIALNATESETDSELWDVQKSTRSLLDSLAGTVDRNVEFSKYAALWRKRGKKIHTIEDLMMCYYSSLRIIRLPTNGRPKLIEAQAQMLYLDIERGCRLSKNTKAQSRMLLNAFEFQAYLNHAFDHFCATLDAPFDFVQCSYLNTRLPTMFAQSILALAAAMVKEKPRPKASTIFQKLGHLIASCIMLDVVRNNIKGSAERVFAQYVPQIDSVLKEFGDRYWPCEFFVKGAVPPHLQAHLDNMAFQQSMRAAAVILRCTNVRSGHAAKGHQLSDGRVFARGAYESQFSFENDRKKVLDSIYMEFHGCMDKLSRLCHQGLNQLEAASTLHRDEAVASYYAPKGDDESIGLRYTAFCVCCLLGAPETLLPCGHMLCRNCVQAYGRRKSNTVVEVFQCPIEANLPTTLSQSQLVYFRPEVAGVRVLALTNGGIRSVIQVEIMKLIEEELDGMISIQSLFDMVIGEGTGGVLALGLIARAWDLETCEENLDLLFKSVFAVTNTHKFPGLGMKSSHTKYRAKTLDEALSSLFPKEQRLIDPTSSEDPLLRSSKLSVLTSSATGRKVLFTNYRRKSLKLPYTQYPVTDYSLEPKVWDIARASMAHGNLFKPYDDPRLGQLFFRKDTSENFLIEVAQNECQAVYRGFRNDFPDVLLCIACGRSKRPTAASILSGETKRSKSSRWTRSEVGDQESYFSEDWSDACAHYPTPNFISLNPLLEEIPDLDDVSSVSRLKELIQEATDPEVISRVVAQLFATLFYAETEKPVKDTSAGETLVPVHVHCRLLDHTEEVVGVGKLLKSGPFRNADFVFWEEGYGPQQFPMSQGMVGKIIRDRQFPTLRLLLPIWQTDAVVHGVLKLENGEEYPLSGFPRQLIANASGPRPKAKADAETSIANKSPPWEAPQVPVTTSWPQELPLRQSVDLYGEPGPVEYAAEVPAYDSDLTALPQYSRYSLAN